MYANMQKVQLENITSGLGVPAVRLALESSRLTVQLSPGRPKGYRHLGAFAHSYRRDERGHRKTIHSVPGGKGGRWAWGGKRRSYNAMTIPPRDVL